MSRGKRGDPYKNFKFLVALVAVGAVLVRTGRKLFTRAERLYPGVYVDEVPTNAAPIKGVGTSTSEPDRSKQSSRSVRRTNSTKFDKRSHRPRD